MSLDCARAAADCAHHCATAYYPNQVTIRTLLWSGERLGDGTPTVESELVLERRPIEQVGDRTVLATGGKLQRGDIRVTDLTPRYTKPDGSQGGYTPEQLNPTLGPANRRREVRYVVAGDINGEFVFFDLDTTDVTAWVLTLRRMRP